MVNDEVKTMYASIVAYIESKISYYEDPGSVSSELVDHISELDLSNLVYHIQRRIPERPSLMESKLIKAYRDLRAAQSEYSMRLMTRSDYAADAAVEETDNRDKWNFNSKLIQLHLLGKESGA